MRAEVREYIAREVVRRYGDFQPRFALNLRRNVRRNFGVTLALEEIPALAQHFKEMYAYGKSVFAGYLGPRVGEYAGIEDIRKREYLSDIAARYPKEPKCVVETVGGYVVYYEYLR